MRMNIKQSVTAENDLTDHSYTETFRHECEVRYVAKIWGNRAKREYILGVRKKRGDWAADRLYSDVKQLLGKAEICPIPSPKPNKS